MRERHRWSHTGEEHRAISGAGLLAYSIYRPSEIDSSSPTCCAHDCAATVGTIPRWSQWGIQLCCPPPNRDVERPLA